VAFPDLLAGADRAALTVLGGPVVYAAQYGAPVAVRGVFDAAYVRTDALLGSASGSGPAVFLRLADLPSDPAIDVDPTVTVAGVEYRVRETRKDGMGGVVLLLNERDA